VLAGFIAPAERWAAFSDEWQRCLDSAPSLKYFKMRHAVNSPSGQFYNWKRAEVRSKVEELVQIIKRHASKAIHCTTEILAFDAILGVAAGPLSNPYCHSFSAILAGIGIEACDLNAERVEVIFDEQDKYSELIKICYPFFRSRLDPELQKVLPSEPMFRPDQEFLPLQAADMLAWLFRNATNGLRTEWEWIATELMPSIPMSEHSSFYTDERLENVRRLSDEFAMNLTVEDILELRRLLELTTKKRKRRSS
jgi:hypothetical protein